MNRAGISLTTNAGEDACSDDDEEEDDDDGGVRSWRAGKVASRDRAIYAMQG